MHSKYLLLSLYPLNIKTMKDKEFNPTEGEWKVNKRRVQVEPQNPLRTLTVCEVLGNDSESKSNAILIADAGTTYNRTGQLPSVIDTANEFLKQDNSRLINEAIQLTEESEDRLEALLKARFHIHLNRDRCKKKTSLWHEIDTDLSIVDKAINGEESRNKKLEEENNILKKKIEEFELDKARQQFTGFVECRSGGDIESLVNSMGLTSNEWETLKSDEFCVLREEDILDIDNFFDKEAIKSVSHD